MPPTGSVFLILPFALSLSAQTPAVHQTEKCSIEGTVTQAGSGTPLPRTEVQISRTGVQEPPLITTTDTRGHFVAGDLEPGRYLVYVRRDGYVGQTHGQRSRNRTGTPLSLGPGQKLRDIDFRLVATGVITGHVLGEEREPLVGMNVQAVSFHYQEGQRREIGAGSNTFTNDLGEYRIYGLQPGRYYIKVSTTGQRSVRRPSGSPSEERIVPTLYPSVSDFRQATRVEVQPGGEVRGIDIPILRQRVFHVRGHIQGADRTARYARVEITPLDRGFNVALTGAEIPSVFQGRFDFGGILPGSYVLSAAFMRDSKSYGAWQRIDVGNADVDDVTVLALESIPLPGRVRLTGDQKIDLSQLRLGLRPTHLWLMGGDSQARVNPDGSFVFNLAGHDAYRFGISGLPEDFYLQSVRWGDEEVTGKKIDLTSAEGPPGALEVLVNPGAARIDGAVKGEKDERAGGVTVVIVPDSGHRSDRLRFKMATTDQNGHFTLRGISPGEYKLFAWEDVESTAWEDPEFLKPYEDKGEAITVEPNGRLARDLRLIPAAAALP